MPDLTEELALSTSRRGLLARVGAALLGASAGGAVKAVIEPGEAEAYHFCGHIYTTDSCPHPTGLPRIDARGLPLRAKDGKRIDNTGRLVDGQGRPVDERGALLRDPDGRPLPPAPVRAERRDHREPARRPRPGQPGDEGRRAQHRGQHLSTAPSCRST